MKTTNRFLIPALAAAVLSGGLLTETIMATALASTPASMSASDTATAAAARFQVAAVVCGSVGCTPVTTKATPRRKLKWLGHS